MVTVGGNRHCEPSSNPGRGCSHFYVSLIPLEKA